MARADFFLGNVLEIRSIEVKALDAFLRVQSRTGEALEDAAWNKYLALVVTEPDVELDRLLAVVPPHVLRKDEHEADHTMAVGGRSLGYLLNLRVTPGGFAVYINVAILIADNQAR